MKKRLFQRRTLLPLILLFALALGLVCTAPHQGGVDQAQALDPGLLPPGFEPPIGKYLLASSWEPAKNATEVPLDANVRVSFNLKLEAITINDGTFHLKKQGATLKVAAATSYTYNAVLGINRATLNPVANLEPGTTYVAYLVNPIVSEAAGLHLFNEGSWSFTTITWPQVKMHGPATGATDVPVDEQVQVVFDHDMDWSTVNSSSFFLQESGGGLKTATLAKSSDKRTVTLTPQNPLDENTTYIVTVTTAVKAENGLFMQAPVTWTFTTAASTPHVTTKIPANGTAGVPVGQVIAATFDTDMDPATLTSATFYIKKSGGTPLPAVVDYSAATRTATLDPVAGLEPGETYEVRLTTAVESGAGTPLASAVEWSFTTAGEAPSVITKVPAAGATSVPVGQTIAATFDKNMDASTLTGATFYVQKSGGSPLPATVAYSSGTRTATLDPAADLEAGATYEVTLTTAVEGADGQTLAGAPITWSFSTAPGGGGGGSSFTDVIPGVTPYATAIVALADEGIISGYTDGTFGPDNPVFRKHFAKMIVGVMGLPVSEADWSDSSKPFTDCGADDLADIYPHDYIAVAKANGLTAGKTATTFAPNDHITRQQLVTMVARAAGLSEPPASFTPSFGASQFYPDEHYLNARKLAYAGLLDGLAGVGPSYDFFAPASRGECAQLLYNLLLLVTS